MTSRDRHNLAKGLAFLSPWLVGFCCFTLIPILLSFYFSLCDYSLLQSPLYIGSANYKELFTDSLFWKSLINTLIYASLALPSAMCISVGLALLLNTKIKGVGVYRTIIFLPSLVPIVASSMVWLWLLNTKLGLINIFLRSLHIPDPDWLHGKLFTLHRSPEDFIFSWAMPSLVLMSLWSVGYTVVIYLAGLQDIPAELYEAAELDGASAISRLFNVTLPMLSPVIFFNLIMAIIGTLQVFALPFIMTSGGPARATYFFTMYLYDNAFLFLRMGYASAMAWIQLLMILALTALAFWSSKRWVHYQGK
jgi:multiple sugar transport system permease protein